MQFWILAPEAVFFCPVVSFGTRQLVYVRVLTDLCAREYGMYVCMYVCICQHRRVRGIPPISIEFNQTNVAVSSGPTDMKGSTVKYLHTDKPRLIGNDIRRWWNTRVTTDSCCLSFRYDITSFRLFFGVKSFVVVRNGHSK
jgi:hypothetical protein